MVGILPMHFSSEKNMNVSIEMGRLDIFLVVLSHFNLFGGLEHESEMTFHILGISSSQLTNSYFFRGVGIPPTSVTMLDGG